MWLEKILESKQRLGLSVRQISERTRSKIPVDTITHILKRITKAPRIDTLLELGEAVELSPHDLFSETTSVAADVNLVALQIELDKVKEKLERVTAERNLLSTKLDALKDELIDIHSYYIKRERSKCQD